MVTSVFFYTIILDITGKTPRALFRRRMDILIQNKKTGKYYQIEVKTGNAVRNRWQIKKDLELAKGNAKWVGRVARMNKLQGPTGKITTYVARPKIK